MIKKLLTACSFSLSRHFNSDCKFCFSLHKEKTCFLNLLISCSVALELLPPVDAMDSYREIHE